MLAGVGRHRGGVGLRSTGDYCAAPTPRHSRSGEIVRVRPTEITLVRTVAFLAVGLSAFLLAGSAAFGLSNRHEEQRRTDQQLATSAGDEAVQVEEYFERARSILLLTAHNPAFRAFYSDPGERLSKVHARTRSIRESEDGLAYIEQLSATSITEVCFIDRGGAENARFVDGTRAPISELSVDESKNPFFAPTFALRPGQVYQAKAYISPDTKTWAISNSTPLPRTGRPARAIVHLEASIASFQQEAAAIARGVDVAIIESETGSVLVDSRKPQQLGAPLGQPKDKRFTRVAALGAPAGAITIAGHRAAFRRLTRAPHNANDWTVVVLDRSPVPSLVSAAGWAPLGMAGAGLALLLIGAFGFRSSRRSLVERDRSQAVDQRRIESERCGEAAARSRLDRGARRSPVDHSQLRCGRDARGRNRAVVAPADSGPSAVRRQGRRPQPGRDARDRGRATDRARKRAAKELVTPHPPVS